MTGVEIVTGIIVEGIEVRLCDAYSVTQDLLLQNTLAHPNGKDLGKFFLVSVRISDHYYTFPVSDQEIGETGGDLGEHNNINVLLVACMDV